MFVRNSLRTHFACLHFLFLLIVFDVAISENDTTLTYDFIEKVIKDLVPLRDLHWDVDLVMHRFDKEEERFGGEFYEMLIQRLVQETIDKRDYNGKVE